MILIGLDRLTSDWLGLLDGNQTFLHSDLSDRIESDLSTPWRFPSLAIPIGWVPGERRKDRYSATRAFDYGETALPGRQDCSVDERTKSKTRTIEELVSGLNAYAT